MPSIQSIARQTRRGLFGAAAPAAPWDAAMGDFQAARNDLARAALELEADPQPDNPAWREACDALHRQMNVMDGAATTILTTSHIANGLGEFFPGLNGVNAAAAFGLNAIAAPATIAVLRAMTHSAHNAINQADTLTGKALSGLGQYAPWGRIGGDVWEWIHAGQVQQEYEAVGKAAPTIEEIREGAATDIGERVFEGTTDFFSGAKTIAIAAAAIAVAIFVVPRVLGRTK